MSELTDNHIKASDYTEADFETLSWSEHIRRRSGMYIGKLGDGSSPDDGIYVLFKEIVDNAIDEFIMGHGKSIRITLGEDNMVTVRDYGRGIPLGKLVDAVSKMNTGAKYGSSAFSKSERCGYKSSKCNLNPLLHTVIQGRSECMGRVLERRNDLKRGDHHYREERNPCKIYCRPYIVRKLQVQSGVY